MIWSRASSGCREPQPARHVVRGAADPLHLIRSDRILAHVLPVQSRWTAGVPEWTLRSLGGMQGTGREHPKLQILPLENRYLLRQKGWLGDNPGLQRPKP